VCDHETHEAQAHIGLSSHKKKVWQAKYTREIHTESSWENLKERDILEELSLYGRIVLKFTLET
jgi:hypothetical protein